MAQIKFPGLAEYERKLSRLSRAVKDEIAAKAIYAGADIVADEVRSAIEGLPIVTGYGTAEHPLPGGVTATQRQGLLDGFGIAPLRDDRGFLNVKLGFDGYNRTKTKQFPGGQPNQLVARGVESGTSWKLKHPFIRPAVTRSRKKAEAKMAQVLAQEMEKIMK